MGKKSVNKKARREATEKAKALGFDEQAIDALDWDSKLGLHVDREDQANNEGNYLPPVVGAAIDNAILEDDTDELAASIAQSAKCGLSILNIETTLSGTNGQTFHLSMIEAATAANAMKCMTWLVHYGIKYQIAEIEDNCFEMMDFLEADANDARHEVLAESLVQAYVDLGQINLLRKKLNQRRGANLRSFVEFSATLERHAARLVKEQLLKLGASPVSDQLIATTSSSKGGRL